MGRPVLGALILSTIAQWTSAACVPDVPETLIANPAVLHHPAIVKAFKNVQHLLQKPYDDNVTRDGLAVAIVHASSPTPVHTFSAGVLKFNETSLYPDDGTENTVNSDSIFRVASVTKNFAMASALVLSQSSNYTITLDSPVREFLPAFHLPTFDWRMEAARSLWACWPVT